MIQKKRFDTLDEAYKEKYKKEEEGIEANLYYEKDADGDYSAMLEWIE